MKKILMFALAGLLVVAFTVPAMAATKTVEERLAALESGAAEWNFYGSARMSTFYSQKNEAYTGTGFKDNDLTWNLQGNSRIGALVKSGDISGSFEYSSTPGLRKLYGEWDFGGGSLLVGQTYTPIDSFYSNQVYGGDEDLLSFGGIYDGRQPMIRLKVGGFRFAAVKPGSDALEEDSVDNKLPEFQACYVFNAGPVGLKFLGGYNQYNTKDTATDNTYAITSWIGGAGVTFGAGPFYANGNVFYGRNLGPMGLYNRTDTDPVWDGTNYKDNNTLGWLAVAGFKVSDIIAFEAGYGHINSKVDVLGVNYTDTAQSYYVQAVITIAKGFFIVPEVGVWDDKTADAGPLSTDEGKDTYFGLKWQINF